jgi:hypothetical protein
VAQTIKNVEKMWQKGKKMWQKMWHALKRVKKLSKKRFWGKKRTLQFFIVLGVIKISLCKNSAAGEKFLKFLLIFV